MSTKFFSKKRESIAFGLSLACIVCALCYALTLCFFKRVDMGATFYFLTAEEEHVEAGAEFVKLEGGAGYLLEVDGEEYVALSVYDAEEEGERVRENLLKTGKKTKLVKAGVERLYFRGKERKNANLYVNALRLFQQYISVLSGYIDRLEEGLTQERCKELLRLLERQYARAEEDYAEYAAYAQTCRHTREELARAVEKTVYLKDLRYLLCWQAERYLQLCAAFV